MNINKFTQYAKFIIGIMGAVVSSLLATLPAAPSWLVIVSTALTAIGVYLTPNASPDSAQSLPDPQAHNGPTVLP